MRILEPGTLNLHIRLFRNLIKCKNLDEADEEKVEPISILFNSTLNIEFVYVILEGIVKFSRINFKAENSSYDVFEFESVSNSQLRDDNGDVTLEIK